MKEKMSKIIAVFAFIATIGIANLSPLTASAAADTCTWTGTTSANWATGTNWTGCDNSGVPENGDTLVFPASASNKSMNNNLAGLTPDQIVISGAGYTFAGNALSNTTSGNFYSATESATINLQTAFNGANTGASVSAGKTLTFAQPQAFGSAFGQYWTGGGTVIFNGNLTGSTGGMFRAENSTTVQVNGATNTFTSSFAGAESDATFECHSTTCFGDNANKIYMGGGIVKIVGSYTIANGIATSTSTPNLSKLTANDNVSITGTGSVVDDLSIEQSVAGKSLQLTGAISLTGSIDVYGANTSSDVKFDGALSGAGNVTVNSGNAWMSASSGSLTGTITVKSGAVALADQINSLGSTSAPTIVEDGGSLELNSPSPVTIAEPLQITGEGTSPVQFKGAIYGASTTSDVTLTGAVTLNGDATVYNESIGNDIALNGVISGTADLTLVGTFDPGGSGSVTFGGGAPNTYIGKTIVAGGTAYFQKTGAVTGDLTVESTSPSTNRAAAYFYSSSNAMANSGVLTLGDNNVDSVTFGEDGEVIGGLKGTNGVVEIDSSGDKLIIDQATDTTYSGTFYTDGNPATIEKRGTGSLTLNGDYQFISDDITFVATAGILNINGNIRTTTGGDVQVAGGTFKGRGTVGSVTTSGGIIAPGNSPGILSVSSLTLDSTNSLEVELDGPVAGTSYDQIASTGAVNLANATLSLKPSYTPASGQVFTIITGSSVTGTFKNIPNNSTVIVDGITFRVNYNAANVTLTYVSGTFDPSGTLANTGTSMLLAAIASIMLIATATVLAARRPRSLATPSE